MLSQIPVDAGCSLPLLAYQPESLVDQLGMLQVSGVSQTLT
jgi:hypothetical protein